MIQKSTTTTTLLPPPLDLSLYFVTDLKLCGGKIETLLRVIEESILGGVSLIQFREKEMNDKEFFFLAKKIQNLTQSKNIPFIINDRVDIAKIIEADGVHIGQSDLNYKEVRKILGKNAIIGISIESVDQAKEAESLDVDYLAVSPLFSTLTKKDTAKPLNLSGLKKIRKISTHSLVAIGGINEKNAKDVMENGADGIATISTIIQAPSPKQMAKTLRKIIDQNKKKKPQIKCAPRTYKKKPPYLSLSDSPLKNPSLHSSHLHSSSLNELKIISHFKRKFSKNVKKEKRNVFGIGDDAGVIQKNDKISYLITTDSLVQNIHFLREKIDPLHLGFKSLAVSISDIAAMGGTPKYSFLNLSLPKDLDFKWIDSFSRGMKKIATTYNISLLGGDTTSSERDIFINMTVIGEIETKNVKYRSNAKPSDLLCVTDFLGDSRGGLQCLLNQMKTTKKWMQDLIQKHTLPQPMVKAGLFFSKEKGVHAMMDLSDGLHSDVQRLMEASSCGARIFIDKIPISLSFKKFSEKFKKNAKEEALIGGEDYSLLLSISKKAFQSIKAKYKKKFSFPLTPIGEVTKKGLSYFYKKKSFTIEKKSFSHF